MSNLQQNQILSDWYYQKAPLLLSDVPEKAIAILYRITHKESGKWYIGRKSIISTKTRMVKGKKKKITEPSIEWHNYWSSSDELQEWVKTEGADKFYREVLTFVSTKAAILYAEEMALYVTGAMFDPLCLNGNIRTKIMRSWFQNKETDLHDRIIKSLHSSSSSDAFQSLSIPEPQKGQ